MRFEEFRSRGCKLWAEGSGHLFSGGCALLPRPEKEGVPGSRPQHSNQTPVRTLNHTVGKPNNPPKTFGPSKQNSKPLKTLQPSQNPNLIHLSKVSLTTRTLREPCYNPHKLETVQPRYTSSVGQTADQICVCSFYKSGLKGAGSLQFTRGAQPPLEARPHLRGGPQLSDRTPDPSGSPPCRSPPAAQHRQLPKCGQGGRG